MSVEEIFKLLRDEFGEQAVTGLHLESRDPWIEVAADALLEVAYFLRDDPRLRFDHLNDLCGVDYLQLDPKKAKAFGYEPHVEVVYHLTSYEHRHALVVKVKVPRWKSDTPGDLPDVPSVSGVWAIADWHEREAYDLVGVHFVGHPNLRRILCPEDWVGHPLRKDYEFPLEYHGIRGK